MGILPLFAMLLLSNCSIASAADDTASPFGSSTLRRWLRGGEYKNIAMTPTKTMTMTTTTSESNDIEEFGDNNDVIQQLSTSVPTAHKFNWVDITKDDFENNEGSFTWKSESKHATRIDAAEDPAEQDYIPTGNAALRISADKGTRSSIYHRTAHDVSLFSSLQVSFSFLAHNLDPTVLDSFVLEYSNDDGSSWQVVKRFVRTDIVQVGGDPPSEHVGMFKNDKVYHETVNFDLVGISYKLTKKAIIRFRCEASSSDSHVFIDEVAFRGTYIWDTATFIDAIEDASKDYSNPSIIMVDPNADIDFASVDAEGLGIDNKSFKAICAGYNETHKCTLKRSSGYGRFFASLSDYKTISRISFEGFQFIGGQSVNTHYDQYSLQNSGGAFLFVFKGQDSMCFAFFTGCDFINNAAHGRGGAVYMHGQHGQLNYSPTLGFYGCTFKSNKVLSDSGQGGTIYAISYSTAETKLEIKQSIFSNNSVPSRGEGNDIYGTNGEHNGRLGKFKLTCTETETSGTDYDVKVPHDSQGKEQTCST